MRSEIDQIIKHIEAGEYTSARLGLKERMQDMQEMPEDMMLTQAYSFIHAAEVKSPEPIKGFYQRLALLQFRVWMRLSGAEEEIRMLQEIAVLVSNSLNNIKVKGLSGKKISLRFCPIAAGTFLMKSNEVKIDQGFYLGAYPVTQEQWEAVMGNNPSRFKGESLPVETVSWDDCQVFIQKLKTLSGKHTFRLPTEEEWEYACRAGSIPLNWWGVHAGQLPEWEWYDCNSSQTTYPVGYNQNGWGLSDMTGNVWEWMYNKENIIKLKMDD